MKKHPLPRPQWILKHPRWHWLAHNTVCKIWIWGEPSKGGGGGTNYPLPGSPTPASTLWTCSAGGDNGDATVASLAGLLARTQPRIYVTTNGSEDGRIQGAMTKYHGTVFNGSSEESLCKLYAKSQCGDPVPVIVYDPGEALHPMQFTIARVLAGLYNALPVTANNLNNFVTWMGGSSHVKVIYDIRTGKGINNWSSKVEGYSWLWNYHAKNDASKSYLACIPNGRGAFTDYLVKNKVFAFEFGSNSGEFGGNATEQAFADEVLSAYPQGTVVMGYVGMDTEVMYVDLLSGGFGKYPHNKLKTWKFNGGLIYNPCEEASNMSLLTGYGQFRAPIKVTSKIPTYVKGHKYVHLKLSQSDAIGVWCYGQIASYMEAAMAAGMPLGVPISNVVSVVAPTLYRWYLDNYNPDIISLEAGTDGAGYNHPAVMPNEDYFCSLAASLDTGLGQKDQFCIFGGDAYNTNVLSDYISKLKAHGFTPHGIFLWESNGHANEVVDGVPVMTIFNPDVSVNVTLADINTKITNAAAKTDLIYIILNTGWGNIPPAQLKAQIAKLGSNYTLVNGYQFIELYKQCLSKGGNCYG